VACGGVRRLCVRRPTRRCRTQGCIAATGARLLRMLYGRSCVAAQPCTWHTTTRFEPDVPGGARPRLPPSPPAAAGAASSGASCASSALRRTRQPSAGGSACAGWAEDQMEPQAGRKREQKRVRRTSQAPAPPRAHQRARKGRRGGLASARVERCRVVAGVSTLHRVLGHTHCRLRRAAEPAPAPAARAGGCNGARAAESGSRAGRRSAKQSWATCPTYDSGTSVCTALVHTNESRDAKLPCTAWRTRSCAAAALAATSQPTSAIASPSGGTPPLHRGTAKPHASSIDAAPRYALACGGRAQRVRP
jgi:hypothetical protein